MSIVASLLSNLPILGNIFGKVCDKVSESDKNAFQLAMKQIENDAANIQAQLEINKIEAQHPSVFVSGWRPYAGWVCGAGLTYEFVLHPFLEWFAQIWGFAVPPHLGGGLTELCFGLLGFGSLRTFEKYKGVTVGR